MHTHVPPTLPSPALRFLSRTFGACAGTRSSGPPLLRSLVFPTAMCPPFNPVPYFSLFFSGSTPSASESGLCLGFGKAGAWGLHRLALPLT